MITIKDLNEAIAECEGERNPNANTCMKLASYYTIKNQFENASAPIAPEQVRYYGGEGLTWNGKTFEELIPLLDELMEALCVLNPKLYNSFIDKLDRF